MVMPGGYAPDRMRRHAGMVAFIREMARRGKVVAAICHGPWMLASAEVVAGKTVTCFFAIKDDLVHAGATYQDAEVVVDGNLITSRQPADLPAFLDAIITALGERCGAPPARWSCTAATRKISGTALGQAMGHFHRIFKLFSNLIIILS